MFGKLMDRVTRLTGSRYAGLLFIALLIFVIFPLVETHRSLRGLLVVLWLGILATALRAIVRSRRSFYSVLSIGIAAVGSNILAEGFSVLWVRPYGDALSGVFFAVMIVMILQDVIHRTRVDIDAVFGACCAYLFLGMAFASVYGLIEWAVPGSFAMPELPAAIAERFGSEPPGSTHLYFSLITMTTVGFGDITPVSPPARVLSAIEGLVAQLYIAILVARLVAMEISNRQMPRS